MPIGLGVRVSGQGVMRQELGGGLVSETYTTARVLRGGVVLRTGYIALRPASSTPSVMLP